MKLEPLKFKPILKSKIWGGNSLQKLFPKKWNKENDISIGESWELSDQQPVENNSIVDGGNFHSHSFRSLLEKYPKEILGKSLCKLRKFPLLYKLIDAKDYLSVQVHPGLKGKPILGEPKTECWYIVEAPIDAKIIVGLDTNLSHSEIVATLQTSEVKKILQYIPIVSGDILFVPAGTVHAITPGLLIYEIQQNSDDTFRLYDWDRTDNEGNSRVLHIEKAIPVLDFSIKRNYKIKPLSITADGNKISYCIICSFFVLKKVQFFEYVLLSKFSVFRVLTLLQGNVVVVYNKQRWKWFQGETLLIPACLNIVEIFGKGIFLESFVSTMETEIQQPLIKAGFSKEQIQSLGQNFL